MKRIGRIGHGYGSGYVSLVTYSLRGNEWAPNVSLKREKIDSLTDEAWESIFIELCYDAMDSRYARGSAKERIETVLTKTKFGYFGDRATFHEITGSTFDVNDIYKKVMAIIKKEEAEWSRLYGNLSLWAKENDCILYYTDKGQLKVRDCFTGQVVAKKYWPKVLGFDSLTLDVAEIELEEIC